MLWCGVGKGWNYATVWSRTKAEGTFSILYDTYALRYQYDPAAGPAEYTIARMALLFDTSHLGTNATIISVNLCLNVTNLGADVWITEPFDIVVQNGQPDYPSNPVVVDDYNRTKYSGDGGSLPAASLITGWNYVPLNATGLTWINKTGYTKLMVRNSNDVAGIAPPGPGYDENTAKFASGANQPYLDIQYLGDPHAHLFSTQAKTPQNYGGFGKR